MFVEMDGKGFGDFNWCAASWVDGIFKNRYWFNSQYWLISYVVGVILCQLVNVIRPGIIPKIYSNSTQYFYIENASNFLKTVESYFGVSKTLMFSAPDLAEGKNPRTVFWFLFLYVRTDSVLLIFIRSYQDLLILRIVFATIQNILRNLLLSKKKRYSLIFFSHLTYVYLLMLTC